VVINNLTAWAYTTGQVHMKSDGTPWRPLVHIEDISRAVVAVLAAPRDVIHNEAFNVGLDSENYQIRQLAEFVTETVPGCELSFAEGAGPDLRNYRVNFGKFARTFPDYPLRWSARAGVKSIYEAYKRIGLGRDDYEGPKYKRIAQLTRLLEAGKLDRTLRWRC
jgi:nucleoside-diphosphate-sugar epimerase